MGIIIGIGGKIGSGKTFWRIKISEYFDCKSISFSDWLKQIAKDRNIENIDRNTLQNIGAEILYKGYDFITKEILQYASWNSDNMLIIDGIRDIGFYNYLKEFIYPNKAILLYIKVEEDIRKKRIRDRNEYLINETHSSEGNSLLIEKNADYVITELTTIDEVYEEIKMKLKLL